RACRADHSRTCTVLLSTAGPRCLDPGRHRCMSSLPLLPLAPRLFEFGVDRLKGGACFVVGRVQAAFAVVEPPDGGLERGELTIVLTCSFQGMFARRLQARDFFT